MNNNNTCAICAGGMEENKCRVCDWEDRGIIKVAHAWFAIHMSILIYFISLMEV